MIKSVVYFLCLAASMQSFGQRKVDIIHYKYEISLQDATDTILGEAAIQFVALDSISTLSFDLAGIKKGRGMKATTVLAARQSAAGPGYVHENDKLTIFLGRSYKKGDTGRVHIFYRGIPADGLIISKNKYGRRTFFSDNWPDRAHHWLPCVDDPADKASVEFVVVAPSNYKVVSNGILVSQKNWDDSEQLRTSPKSLTVTHWKEDIPLPTKIMVIGVADFAVDTAGIVDGVPVTSWVFPENKKDGFYDYAPAKDILAWLSDYIGPFPYKKLANVQSKTIFGGMENAGAIFYHENSITGNRREEALLAHEIAHQWFGDMATEKSFSHLWLSEGFATYLSHLYLEAQHGTSRLEKEMREDREQAINFAATSGLPVVDSTTPYMDLLNANSYQKGGWILHMLRRQLGNAVFQQIIRNYYAAYAGRNADSRDFQKICEKTSGKDLEKFFHQWLYTPGCPRLDVKWKYDPAAKKVLVTVTQLQPALFEFPLEILVQTGEGRQAQSLHISKQTQQFSFGISTQPVKLVLDPAVSLLFDGTVAPW